MRLPKISEIVVLALTVACFVSAFPSFNYANLAFVLMVPFLAWAYFSTSKQRIIVMAMASSWISWFAILIWLRHVTWVGVLVTSGYTALFIGTWMALSGILIKKISQKTALPRILSLLGLSGLWVVLEWARSIVFSGFPWMTLATTQWERPALLQLASYTGSYGISFIIIFFNLALATFVLKLYNRYTSNVKRSTDSENRPIELYVAIIAVLGALAIFVKEYKDTKIETHEFKVGVIQPDISPLEKWDESKVTKNFKILWEQTIAAGKEEPDLILWPETAVPTAMNKDENCRQWIVKLANEIQTPILAGALGNVDQDWYNAIFKVTAQEGVADTFYAKEHRVPFGEYVPMRKTFSILDKFVPVDFDLTAGKDQPSIAVNIKDKEWNFGGLICFEDIFPELARARVLAGADVLVVLTNNAWYGREAGAYQHGANSVMRAVEMRRPILRCGNNGLSGWIDEYGVLREVATHEGQGVYFRGMKVFDFSRHDKWVNKNSFYVEHGDWFVAFSGVLFLLGGVSTISRKKKK